MLQMAVIGILATATLDVWALALNRIAGLPITNWSHVGRWASGIPSGTTRHVDIAAAPPVAYEKITGWSTHYLVGIAYSVIYLSLMGVIGKEPGILSATLFGIATVLAPWLILQPCLGIGYFAANAGRPNLIRGINLLSHSVFGIGLYFGYVASTLVF